MPRVGGTTGANPPPAPPRTDIAPRTNASPPLAPAPLAPAPFAAPARMQPLPQAPQPSAGGVKPPTVAGGRPPPPGVAAAPVAAVQAGTAPTAAAAPLPGPPKPAADPGSDARVVVVIEDDRAIREMLVRSLGTEYCVYEASDGQAALDLLAAIKLPALIVCDVMMPRMDGLTFAARIKADARLKALPLIFLTGLDSPKDVVNGINAGARHYLTKPFKIPDLMAKVSKAIGPKR